MDTNTTRRSLLVGTVTAVGTSLAGCTDLTTPGGSRTETSRTVTLRGSESLTVKNLNGDVTLQSADRSDLRVQLVKRSDASDSDLSKLKLRTASQGEQLRLHTEWTGKSGFTGRPHVHLNIDFPKSLSVDSVSTEGGDVQITGGIGDTTIQTESGDVQLDDVVGNPTISTESGDIQLEDVDGDARLSTESGDMTVTGIGGDTDVSTESGDLELNSADGIVSAESGSGTLSVLGAKTVSDLQSGSGDITAEVNDLDGKTTFTSESGDLTARVARDLDAVVTARSESDEVDVSELTLSDADVSESRATGTLGDGGTVFRLLSESGDVTVSYLS